MNIKYAEWKINRQMRKWEKEKEILQKRDIISQEKEKFKNDKKNKSFSKKILWFLFGNCTLIELFTFWSIAKSFNIAVQLNAMPDFTPLVTLIGAVVGEVVGFAIYAAKAAKENSKDGITYELAMKNREEEF